MIFIHRANTLNSLEYAAQNGWGVEIDLRVETGGMFLRHGLREPSSLEFSDVAPIIKSRNIPTILNLKTSSVVEEVYSEAKRFGIVDMLMLLDLTVPDTLLANTLGLQTLIRVSKYENYDIYPNSGKWIDYCITEDEVKDMPLLLDRETNKSTLPDYIGFVYVSPELQGKPLLDSIIKDVKKLGLSVCTDLPGRWM